MTEDKEVQGRLATVEREVATIVTSMDALGRSLNRLESGQTELTRTLTNRAKANWPVVITAAGAFLTLLVFYTGMVSGPIAERLTLTSQFTQEQIDDINDDILRIEQRQEAARGEIKSATDDRFRRADFESWLLRQALEGKD